MKTRVQAVGALSEDLSVKNPIAESNRVNDEARLQSAIQLLSTFIITKIVIFGSLNEQCQLAHVGGTGELNFQEDDIQANNGSKIVKYTEYRLGQDRGSSRSSRRSRFARLEKILTTKLFQMNHVVLTYQSVSVLFFHIVLFLSFLQIMFNIFYKLEIVNDFSQINQEQLLSSNASSSVSTDNNATSDLLNKSISGTIIEKNFSTFRIDEAFQFVNFQFYALKSNQETNFILLYSSLNGLFIFFLILLITLPGRTFEQSKTGDTKESTKLMVKALSVLMCLFLFFLQIPMITLQLQGFLCEESPGDEFTLPSLQCDSLEHRLLVCSSIVLLGTYVTFLFVQTLFYCSSSFEQVVPWNTFDRKIALVKILIKLVISIGFVFDKAGDYRWHVNLICFFIQLHITVKRYKEGVIFNTSVNYAVVLYETISTWLYLTISLHILFQSEISACTLLLIFFIGACIALGNIVFQNSAKKQVYVTNEFAVEMNPLQYMVFFQRLYTQIERGDLKSEVLLNGKLFNHLNNCTIIECQCKKIAESFIFYKEMRAMLSKYELEEQIFRNQYCIEDHDVAGQLDQQDLISNTPSTTMGGRNTTKVDLQQISSADQSLRIKRVISNEQSRRIVMMDLALSTSQNLQTVSGGAINIVQERSLSPEKPAGRRQFPEVYIEESNQKQLPIDRRGSIFRQPSYYPQPAAASMTGQSLALGSMIQGAGGWENFNEMDYEMKMIDKYTMNQILRRRRSDFYQKLSSVDDNILENDKVLKNRYRQLTIIIKDAIEKFPTSIELRRINAYIQKAKLKNEFKAIFEMMNCELCDPSIYEKFIIFREKIEVEQCLVMQYQKNILRVGTLDVAQVFNYEKLFQKYQLYEYLTGYAALQFWKELLEKNINAAVLQERGSDISKNYEIIQNISEKLQEIYPNEIKFLYRYGIFLLKIIHNEYDSLECFRKAQTKYVGKDSKKGAQMPVNEQTIFGENTAAGIVVISATSSKIGTIIHCNEEVESVLGFQKQDIIGSNVTVLIPRPIAKVHDRLIQRYFETAKPTVIEIKRYLLANSRDGYLKEIELIVKVFPQVNEQIVFIGFISKHDRFDDMEQVKPEFEKLDKQYIITDVEGNITNITEGLKLDIGLHSKFFQYSDSMFQQMFNIQQICPEIFENDQNLQDLIEGEGRQLAFDTRNILNNIELEQLNADDIEDIRENLGLYKVYVQLKKVAVSTYCQFHIYRIILLARYKDWDSLNQGHPISNYVLTNAEGETNQFGQQERQLSLGSGGSNGHADNNSMSSVSSSQSQGFTFNRVIKDFKKALSERKTPQNLILLNRIIILVLFIIVILSSVEYVLLRDDTTKIESQNLDNLMSETRQLKLIQLSSNLRSYVNIANGLEFDRYEGNSLQAIDRFEYLGRLIQSQAVDLQEVHEYLTQRRGNGRLESSSSQISHFEYEKIKLFRLDENNQVTQFEQPFRVAFQIFLNQIQVLNQTDRSALTLPNDLLEKPPRNDYQLAFKQGTSQEQKAAYFLIINGLRSLRTKSTEATQLMRRAYEEDSSLMTFLTIMLIAIFMSCFAFGIVLYQVWVIERNKAKILSLYALLSMTEISEVYHACEQFMDRLNQGSVIMHLSLQRKCVKELEDCKLELAHLTSQLVKQDTAPQDYFISDDPQSTASLVRHKKISIEPPEDRQKQKRLNDLKLHIANLQSRKANFYGNEIYKEMINNTQEVMKVLVEAEEQEKENFKVMRITQKRMLVSNSRKIDQQKKVVKVKGTSNADLLQPTAIFAEQSRVKRIEKNVSDSVKGGKAEIIREHRDKILNSQKHHFKNGHGHQSRQDESASSDNIKIPVKGKHQVKKLTENSKKSNAHDKARDSEDETNILFITLALITRDTLTSRMPIQNIKEFSQINKFLLLCSIRNFKILFE